MYGAGGAAACARPPLPAGPARGRAHLLRDGRDLARRADRHTALRRERDRRALRGTQADYVPAAAAGRLAAELPCPAAGVPDSCPSAGSEWLRLRRVEQQRLRSRRAPGRRGATRLLLPLAFPLRLARAGAGAVRGTRGAAPGADP